MATLFGRTVADTGVGISEETQANLFNISLNSSTRGRENKKGTGLGLMLCQEFIEKHKGEIRVKSKLNEGITVFFTYPNKE
jgi:signal transduction histidine kinase